MKHILTLIAALLPGVLLGATYYVDASRPNDAGNGLSWATAKQTIQAAVDLAANGDTVLVTNGVYATGGAPFPGEAITNRICITNSLVLKSVNGPHAVTVVGSTTHSDDATNEFRCVYAGVPCTIVGFTFSNGCTVAGHGAGVYGHEDVVLSNCILVANRTYDGFGGGVYAATGGVIVQCILLHNGAMDGGGALLGYGGLLLQSSLMYNTAGASGGGAVLHGAGRVYQCQFVSNVTSGVYLGDGGGGLRASGMVTLDHTWFVGNAATAGAGGAYVTDGVFVTNAVFIGNSSMSFAGGLYIGGNCTACDLWCTSNTASDGGGAYAVSGARIRHAVFIGNSAEGSGGGIAMYSHVRLEDAVLMANEAWNGGGAYLNDYCSLNSVTVCSNNAAHGGGVYALLENEMSNCLLHDNTATGFGGGANMSGGTVARCLTVTRNGAEFGGGVFLSAFFADPTVQNSIIWGNSAVHGADVYRYNNRGVLMYSCASQGVTHGNDGCITLNPLFAGPANDWQLQSASPCVNAGNNAYAPTNISFTDLVGNPRIYEDVVDMGCYEFVPEPGGVWGVLVMGFTMYDVRFTIGRRRKEP